MPPKLSKDEIAAIEGGIEFAHTYGELTIIAREGAWLASFGDEAAMRGADLRTAIARAMMKRTGSERLATADMSRFDFDAFERDLRAEPVDKLVQEAKL